MECIVGLDLYVIYSQILKGGHLNKQINKLASYQMDLLRTIKPKSSDTQTCRVYHPI
jgi:hypothetical protein